MNVLCAVLLAILSTVAWEAPSAERPATAILVTSDAEFAAEARKTWWKSEDLGEFAGALGDRVWYEPKEGEQPIFVDLESGMIARLRDQKSAIDGLLATLGENFVFDTTRMTHQQAASLTRLIRGFPIDPDSGTPYLPQRMRLAFSRDYEVTGSDGRSISIRIPIRSDGDAAFHEGPVTGPPPVVQDIRPELKEAEGHDTVGVVVLGESMSAAVALRQALPAIERLQAELDAELARAVADLLRLRGLDREWLGGGVLPLSAVPDALRKEAEDSFAASWEAKGFASEDEARLYFAASSGLRITTVVGWERLIRSRDRSSGQPASAARGSIAAVGGTPLP